MNMIATETLVRDYNFPGTMTAAKQGVVALFSDDAATIANLEPVCEFLDLRLEVVSAGTDLMSVLRSERPMAVISDVDGLDHDGFHAMKLIARYNPDLPILLLTGGDEALMGAADAIQEIWGLTSVTRTSDFPLAGQLVGFLFTAGRRAGCMRLVPV
jgi:CheY-like chemotaxis protein